jgi:hypothetical protein
MIGVLVGNKCEYRDGTADSRAEVTREEGASAASDMCLLKYFETSAVGSSTYILFTLSVYRSITEYVCMSACYWVEKAENINVEEPFHFIAQEFYDR